MAELGTEFEEQRGRRASTRADLSMFYSSGGDGDRDSSESSESEEEEEDETVVMVQTPVFFTDKPIQMECGFCHAKITTVICQENGALIWTMFGVFFVLGIFLVFPWFLCWIPFCFASWKDVVHRCPKCNAVLGDCPATISRGAGFHDVMHPPEPATISSGAGFHDVMHPPE